jgi:hypothetical protein
MTKIFRSAMTDIRIRIALVLVVILLGVDGWLVLTNPSGGQIDKPATVHQHIFARQAPIGEAAKYVPETPNGFISLSRNPLSEAQTGPQLLAQASTGMCTGSSFKQLQARGWVASDLRYWSGTGSNQNTYVTLCLSQMTSSKAAMLALQNFTSGLESQANESNFVFSTLPQIPGAVEVSTRRVLSRLAYAKGRFFVLVVAGSSSGQSSSVVTSNVRMLAISEYDRLPEP